jgi:putative hemolysin
VSAGLLLLLLGMLLLASAALSGSETGLYAVNRHRVHLRAAVGDRGAQRLDRLLRSPAAVLGALLIGNNLVNFAMTATLTTAIAERGWPSPEWWTTVLLSPVVLVLGEMTPKNLFRRRADAWMPRCSLGLTLLRWGLAPLVAPVLLVERVLAGARVEQVLSREHLRGYMVEGVEQGLLSAAQHDLAHGVMRFTSLPVGRIAVPWARATTVSSTADRAACIAAARASGHTRLPVVGADARVAGVLHVQDFIFQPDAPLASLVRALPAFAAGTPADDVLRRMAAGRHHLALVGTDAQPLGLLSFDDLLTAVLGPPARTAPGRPTTA